MGLRTLLRNSSLFKRLNNNGYLKSAKDRAAGRLVGYGNFVRIEHYLLECLYTINTTNPTAIKIYLYLLKQIKGWINEVKVKYSPATIMRDMKIPKNSRTTFLNAMRMLQEYQMISISSKDGEKFIFINCYPDAWNTPNQDDINAIIEYHLNNNKYLAEKQSSSSSSSSTSSSSSSSSNSSMEYSVEENEVLRELDDGQEIEITENDFEDSDLDDEDKELLSKLDDLDGDDDYIDEMLDSLNVPPKKPKFEPVTGIECSNCHSTDNVVKDPNKEKDYYCVKCRRKWNKIPEDLARELRNL